MKKIINFLIIIYLLIPPLNGQKGQKGPQKQNRGKNVHNYIENPSNSQNENPNNSQNKYPNNNQNMNQNNIQNKRTNNLNSLLNCKENKNHPNCLKEELEQIYEELKSIISLFINNMKNTTDSFSQLKPQEQIEHHIKDKANFESLIGEYFESYLNQENKKQIMEKAIELAGFLTQKDCTNIFNFTSDILEDENFKENRNGKKEILSKVIESIKDYAQCNNIDELFSQGISDNKQENFKYILFLIYEISSNPDSLNEGQSEVLYNISLCLEKYFNTFWGSVGTEISDSNDNIDEKDDISLILFKTLSNLVNINHYDEIDEYHDEYNNIPKFGIMRDKQSKKFHKEILDFSQQFHDFGNGINIISSINNSILKFDDLKDGKIFAQEIFCDSPFDCLDDLNYNNNDNIVRDFICISIYDENGDEINITDLQEEDKPYYYNQRQKRNMKQCIFFNESNEGLDKDGINSEDAQTNGEVY